MDNSGKWGHKAGFPEFSGDAGISSDTGQVVALNFQRQNEHGYHNGQWIQSNKQNGFTHRDRWLWLTDHGVPRTKIGTLLECYPICISRKALGLITRTRS